MLLRPPKDDVVSFITGSRGGGEVRSKVSPVRGCLHDTGATFAPRRVHSGSLSWLYICLHDTPTKSHAGASRPGVSSFRLSASRREFTPDSHPLLCFFRYHVNHAVLVPIESLIGSALALSKIKNCVVNRTTPQFPARSLRRYSLDTSLHHLAKFSLQCFVNYSRKERAPRKVFHGRIFLHQTEKY